jgi:hypothetical protein
MCKKIVTIPEDVEFQMKQIPMHKDTYEIYKQLVKQSAIQNINKRTVFLNDINLKTGSYSDWIIASDEDRILALDKLLKQEDIFVEICNVPISK